MFKTNSRQEVMEVMEVLTGPERRRRRSAEEKAAMVRESLEPGKTVSMVAVEYRVTPLGQTLKAPFQALYEWSEITRAQHAFDLREQD